MERRTFLTLSAALGSSTFNSWATPQHTTHTKRIIVIGAGVAGLTAARDLVAQGHSVTVIEAQSRIGGRLKTNARLGVPLDLGASWIHGVKGNPITALAQTLGAQMASTTYDSTTTFDHVRGMVAEIQASRQKRLEALQRSLKQWIRSAQKSEHDQSLYATIWNRPDVLALEPDDQQLLRHLMNASQEAEYGGNSTRAQSAIGHFSTHWFDNHQEFGGGDKVFAAGFQQIALHLAKGLRILTGERVRKLDYGGAGIRISTDKGTHSADAAIVAVPLGVLQAGHIEFTPHLPAAHTQAIHILKMGLLNKLYLKFETDFWTADSPTDWIESICAPEAPRQEWTQWVNFKRPLRQNILMGFNAGDTALEMEALSDAAIVDSAMSRLRSIYGQRIPAPTSFLITRWRQDPFTLGAYSFNALGTSATTRATLAQAIAGKLTFAGEATHPDHWGVVHGAYLSGQRAAEQLA